MAEALARPAHVVVGISNAPEPVRSMAAGSGLTGIFRGVCGVLDDCGR